MNLTFENKTALVVGAAGGIGFATAQAFAESGAKVVMADINRTGIAEAAEKLRIRGFEAVGIACNVAVKEVKQLVKKIEIDVMMLDEIILYRTYKINKNARPSAPVGTDGEQKKERAR